MQTMSPEEYRTFLLDTVRTGKLATVRADGRPHVAPIWFDLDGEAWVFMTWHESVKARNMQRDGRVSICVDDDQPPFSFVIIEGTVNLIEAETEERVYWAGRIGGRYMGADQAEAYGQRNGVAGELIVRVTPSKIIAKKNVSA